MADVYSSGHAAPAASVVLGCKLDSIPFSAYHLVIIAVLALVGLVEGYDLSMTGLLLVLAKEDPSGAALISITVIGHRHESA